MPRRALACLLALASGTPGCRGSRRAVPEPPAATSPRQPAEPPVSKPPGADYPTPALAGTEELFLIEEPPRGPHVTNVKLLNRAALKFTEHLYCEVGPARLVCSAAHPKPGAAVARWNVGRDDDHVVLAERLLPSGRVTATYLFDWD